MQSDVGRRWCSASEFYLSLTQQLCAALPPRLTSVPRTSFLSSSLLALLINCVCVSDLTGSLSLSPPPSPSPLLALSPFRWGTWQAPPLVVYCSASSSLWTLVCRHGSRRWVRLDSPRPEESWPPQVNTYTHLCACHNPTARQSQ